LDSAKNKLCPTPEELNPNSKFADNSFAAQFSENEAFVKYIKEHKLSWVNYPTTIKNLYETIVSSDFYSEYMNSSTTSFEEDRDLWRKIFKRCILSNEELLTSLEEQSIYWNDDLEIVVSFILKTIKKFEFEDGITKPLLPMFKDDEDRMFASKLFRSAILNAPEYKALIDEHTKNWEIDRIAFMDVVIMQLALAEIQNFPTIPVNVTLNEYIEISKTYSTDRSSNFINGVLDNIVTQLKNENKLVKAKIFSLNQK
jgi:N utilization substance protein B